MEIMPPKQLRSDLPKIIHQKWNQYLCGLINPVEIIETLIDISDRDTSEWAKGMDTVFQIHYLTMMIIEEEKRRDAVERLSQSDINELRLKQDGHLPPAPPPRYEKEIW